jgi:hypothetical protein
MGSEGRKAMAKRLFLVIPAWVAVVAACSLAAGCQSPPHSQIKVSTGRVVLKTSDPLIVGQRTSVAGASAAVGFRVLTPRPSPAIARVDIAQVWVNSKLRQVALVLDNRKITVMMWPVQAARRNAVKYFRAFMAQNHASIYIGRVNGSPALVIRPRTDAGRSNPAWIEFYRHGIDINIYSASFGPKALLELAASMR